MVRELPEKDKKIEPGQPAFSLYALTSDTHTVNKKTDTTKTDGPLLTQIDQHHVKVTLPNNDCWSFESKRPITLESEKWSSSFLQFGLKGFTDPHSVEWKSDGKGGWISNTPGEPRLWQGKVHYSLAEAKHQNISFMGKDGLQITISDKGTEDVGFDRSSPGFKKDLAQLLRKYDLNHNGCWDRAELDTALRSAAGPDAVKLAALDESFSDIASLDSLSSKKLTKISSLAWGRLDKSAHSLEHHVFSGKHDTPWKIAAQVADSLRNGYLDLIASGADKPLKELRQEASNEIDKIHQQYKIDIAQPGERPHLDQSFRVKDNKEPYLSGSRTPHLYELRVLEAAIKQSDPSYLTHNNSQAIKFYFLNGTDLSDAAAFWNGSDKDKRPFVAIQPQHPSQNMDELKQIYLHELIHNGQHNMGWDLTAVFQFTLSSKITNAHNLDFLADYDHKRKQLPVLSKDLLNYEKSVDEISSPSGEYGKKMARAMGWQLDKDGLVVGLKCLDGLVYKPAKYSSDVDWRSVSQKFPWLEIKLDSETMQKMAVFGAPTDYFPDPKEMHAESKMLSCDGAGAELSPQLLQVIQADDQAEINSVYGVAENGQPKRIRREDGILIDNPACKQTLTGPSDTTSTVANPFPSRL